MGGASLSLLPRPVGEGMHTRGEKMGKKIVRITARQDGFYRCGIQHSAKPTEYPADQFTEEQIEILKAEPMLIVQVFDEKDREIIDSDETAKLRELVASLKADIKKLKSENTKLKNKLAKVAGEKAADDKGDK